MDDCFAAEDDVLCAVDLGPTRDLVARVLERVSWVDKRIGGLLVDGMLIGGGLGGVTYGLDVLAFGGFWGHFWKVCPCDCSRYPQRC